MSTSETVKFDVCECPCGEGKIVNYVTTQDNPWSGADSFQVIECDRCRLEWSLSYGRLTLNSSKVPHDQAICLERTLYRQIEVVAAAIYKREFEVQKLKTKKAQLSYFSDNGLTDLDYRQYLKYLNCGHQPWTVCRWPRNVDWLIERCNAEEKSALESLLDGHSMASQERELAAKQIVTRSVNQRGQVGLLGSR